MPLVLTYLPTYWYLPTSTYLPQSFGPTIDALVRLPMTPKSESPTRELERTHTPVGSTLNSTLKEERLWPVPPKR